MKIPNYGDKQSSNKLFEPPIRLLVTGPSNSRKTNLVCHLLRQCTIPYSTITVYTKHKGQKLFKDLHNMMKDISKKVGYDIMNILDSDDIPNTNDYKNDPSSNHCVIFDDLINTDKKTLRRISDHFVEGRHSGLSCIFISQDYHQTPRPIHLNSNHIIVFCPPSNTYSNLIERENGLMR